MIDLRAIYESELGYVWNTLRRLGVPPRDLEDVTHDMFLVVHRRLADYDRDRPIRPWLVGIAFRVASEYRRKHSHKRELLREAEEPRTEPVAEARIAEAEGRALVTQALRTLDLDRGAVLVMHDLDGYPVPQIAEALSIPLNTAYSRLRLARKDFASEIRRIRLRGGAA